MTVFESLLMAHILGDWLLQTEWQALNKATNWRAMLTHVIIYHVIVLAFLVARFGFAEPRVYAVVVVLAVIHVILDRQRPVRQFMRVLRLSVDRDPEGWLRIAIDQSLHLLVLGIATLVLTR